MAFSTCKLLPHIAHLRQLTKECVPAVEWASILRSAADPRLLLELSRPCQGSPHGTVLRRIMTVIAALSPPWEKLANGRRLQKNVNWQCACCSPLPQVVVDCVLGKGPKSGLLHARIVGRVSLLAQKPSLFHDLRLVPVPNGEPLREIFRLKPRSTPRA